MNCINHPETPVTAYCQNCGKPLCTGCVRQVANVTYCEPCLAARLGVPTAAGTTAASYSVGDAGQFHYSSGPLPPGMPDGGPNPVLATVLGFIPGVGAMYNGQFVKAFIHVLVFVIIVSMTNELGGLFAIFIPAWVFYQVFDAHQTAKARRDGLPLPDPFGLNELGVRLGIQRPTHGQAYAAGTYPPASPYSGPGPVYAGVGAAPGVAPGTAVPEGAAAYAAVPPAYSSVYPAEGYAAYEPPPPPSRRPEPIGAIILIALGLMFLLGTMGIFHFYWIGRSWPLILIGVGIWIFIKRSRELPPGGGL